MYRLSATGLEVLLVHPGGPFFRGKDAGVWSIPKGQYAPGEEALACALREFAEETGHEAPNSGLVELGEVRQASGKIVTAWAVRGDLEAERIVSGTFLMEWPPRSGLQRAFPEVDRAGWFSLAGATEKILPGQRPLLDRLAGALGGAGLAGGAGPDAGGEASARRRGG